MYLECWNNEPDNRPTVDQVVERLNLMILASNNQSANYDADLQLPNEQQFKPNNDEKSSNTNNSLHGELSNLIQNFDELNTNEMIESLTSRNNLLENKFSKIVEEIVDNFLKIINSAPTDTSRPGLI